MGIACVAGGIVGARNKVLAAEPRGELWNTACKKTMGFWIVRTPVCGKNGLVEKSTHVNQMLNDPSYIFQRTLWFAYDFIPLQWSTSFRRRKNSANQYGPIWPFGFAINTLSCVVCLPHKFSTFNSAEKCGTRGVIISWLTSKDMFSLFVAFEGVDSGKLNDFLVVERPLYKFFFAWGLLSGEDTDDGRRRLILTCVSWCEEQSGTSTFLFRPECMNLRCKLSVIRHACNNNKV